MSAAAAAGKHRMKTLSGRTSLVCVIADEDTVTGFMLAGIGDLDSKRRSNYLIVNKDTDVATIEEAFKRFTVRDDISVLLISQPVAVTIRYLLDEFESPVPAILEIPSKDKPYEPSKDPIFAQVCRMTGRDPDNPEAKVDQ